MMEILNLPLIEGLKDDKHKMREEETEITKMEVRKEEKMECKDD